MKVALGFEFWVLGFGFWVLGMSVCALGSTEIPKPNKTIYCAQPDLL